MQFSDLPQSWSCPQCQSPKPYFESQMLTIAGETHARTTARTHTHAVARVQRRAERAPTRPRRRPRASALFPCVPSGFAENQAYGLGGNTLTEGQKSNVIFGGLFAGFLLLMSGYLLT